jgi:hypothetical protein
LEPAIRLRASRTGFGIAICPFDETVIFSMR